MKNIFAFFASCLLPFAYCLLPFDASAEQINPVRKNVSNGVKIVVSVHPLYDITKQVGKDRVIVKTLLPPAASPHTFEPTPKQMMEIWDAKAFIKIGAGLEFWAERVVQAVSNKNLVVVDLSIDMPLIYSSHAHDHKMEGSDPHYWLDPLLAKRIVDRVAGTLIKIDPANKKFYTANAEEYKKELDKLHQEIIQKVSQFRTKEYATYHAAWNYFSRRYGLKVIGVIEEAPGREPSPVNIAKIINELKRANARVVFAEPQFNPRVAEAIAKEVGARVLFLDPIGAFNAPDRDTYIKLMRYNLYQMERAMK
jgi:zinc transport system substrate-binding protein